ncbi:MAG TPA: hypothetical protein PKC30_00030 [Saprospiraceae bacterium]|nr:hypothetical protein [Saprospiraceae bacterium]
MRNLLIWFFIPGILITSSASIYNQDSIQTQKDLQEINIIITTLYDVITGPPGERDWKKFLSLYHESATMGSVSIKEGVPLFTSFTPTQYIERNGSYFTQNGFYEEEIHRKVQIFGNIAQVWTSYKILSEPEGMVRLRGINAVQLSKHQSQWQITNIIWQPENQDLQLPLDMSLRN